MAAYRAALGTRLAAAYALGSLAHGGFSPLVSDVDLGLIMEDPARISDRLTVRTVARAYGPGIGAARAAVGVLGHAIGPSGAGPRRPVPPAGPAGLLEHGRLLTGRDARAGWPAPGRPNCWWPRRVRAPLPGRTPALPVRAVAWARPRPGNDGALADIRDPARLAARGPRRITKVVLFPIRFLFTAQTGRVGTNAAAAERYLASPGVPGTGLVRAALAWRHDRRPPVRRPCCSAGTCSRCTGTTSTTTSCGWMRRASTGWRAGSAAAAPAWNQVTDPPQKIFAGVSIRAVQVRRGGDRQPEAVPAATAKEGTMHPLITQAILIDHEREMHTRAALAAQARRARRSQPGSPGRPSPVHPGPRRPAGGPEGPPRAAGRLTSRPEPGQEER